MARQYGNALGVEARGKGVDVLLGPMMNMARVYEHGRAFAPNSIRNMLAQPMPARSSDDGEEEAT